MRPGIRREMSPHSGVKKGATGYARGAPLIFSDILSDLWPFFKNEFSLADGNAHFPWTQLQLPFNFKPVVAQLLDAHVANDASGFGKRSSLSW